MNRIRSVLMMLLVAGFVLSSFIPHKQKSIHFDPVIRLKLRPNIVWLVAENLSPILPAYGDSTVDTPNIDRLAREGVIYTRVFSPSRVCAPSRCALATGLCPSGIGGHNMRVQYVDAHMQQLMRYYHPDFPELTVNLSGFNSGNYNKRVTWFEFK